MLSQTHIEPELKLLPDTPLGLNIEISNQDIISMAKVCHEADFFEGSRKRRKREDETKALFAWKARRKGREYYDSGQYDRAWAVYDMAVAEEPEDRLGLLGFGFTQRALKRPAEASEIFEKILHTEPYDEWAKIGLALCHLDVAHKQELCFVEAHRHIRELLLHLRSSATGWYVRALIFFKQAQWEKAPVYRKALVACNKALHLKKGYTAVLKTKGNTLTWLGRRDEAIAMWDEVIRLDSKQAHTMFMKKASCYRGWGNDDKALEACEEMIKTANSSFGKMEGWQWKGEIFEKQKRWSQAIKAAENGIQESELNYRLWELKARALLKNGQEDAALNTLDEGIKIAGHSWLGVWHQKGDFFNECNRYPQAVKAYQEAVRLKPLDVDVWKTLGLIQLEELKDYVAAEATFKDALTFVEDEDLKECHQRAKNLLQEQGKSAITEPYGNKPRVETVPDSELRQAIKNRSAQLGDGKPWPHPGLLMGKVLEDGGLNVSEGAKVTGIERSLLQYMVHGQKAVRVDSAAKFAAHFSEWTEDDLLWVQTKYDQFKYHSKTPTTGKVTHPIPNLAHLE